ncbi:hydroxyacylglutathione hydrolase [Xylophilus rhododendri]|uniref:Hydroxyacylglutathione hydrolase n=1 Tax=Xylophilus rhododendri TaxID=2697032 RepID=A0A857J217_9BURK|nr:hydroxyacylglutathione hydrolase [Xylophilus rhododendri]QHI96915.1 hydroxyacylglutathione hydrolase [Xylophilus rhododendri]
MVLDPLPAFSDNYIWMLRTSQRAVVVDPGEAAPVFQALSAHGLQLEAILVTHHHADHTGGVAELREATGCRVIGPAAEAVPEPAERVSGGDRVQALGLQFEVLDVPGHTAGHIAFFCAEAGGEPLVFSGDTLFSAGCGRLFEGTPAQMLASLDALGALPPGTRVCCGHEYTLSNLKFARAVEPGNSAVADHVQRCEGLRAKGLPTVPSTLALEHQINPFLRSRTADVTAAVRRFAPATPGDETSVFAALRQWKNEFR